MIHDGPANYTRHGKTISVSRFLLLTLPAVDPVFCANRRNYLREKIAKNPIFPFSSRAFFPLPFLSLSPSRTQIRARNHTSFCGHSFCSSALLPIAYWYTILPPGYYQI